ncbi:SseB family protein [Kocuria rhizophila]|nr:SseB family protein [Kocuria rhizophila]
MSTSTEALGARNADARPVAADIRRAALSAVQDGSSLLVVDPASDPAFAARRRAVGRGEGRSGRPRTTSP